MTLAAIRARLYRGFHPEEFGGKDISGGRGCFRAAYRVGDYVVKHRHRHCGHTRKRSSVREELAWLGIHVAQQWVVKPRKKRAWIIQPFYRRLNWSRRACRSREDFYQHNTDLDIHTHNLGYDRDWNLIAFDY